MEKAVLNFLNINRTLHLLYEGKASQKRILIILLGEETIVGNAPSGTVYYDGNGEQIVNLGVHEHWNNSALKQYSRNPGEKEGIELVFISPPTA